MTSIYFKLTPEQRNLIEQKMKLAGIQNMSAYIRKMCIDGYTISLDIRTLTELTRLMRNTSNNVNQVAHRVNLTGDVFSEEVQDLKKQFDEIKVGIGEVLRELSKVTDLQRK